MRKRENVVSLDMPLPELSDCDRIAFVDSTATGALFGPIIAAAAIYPASILEELVFFGIKDSKKVAEKLRPKLARIAKEKAISWGIGVVTAQEIHELNCPITRKGGTWRGDKLAMKRAIEQLNPQPDLIWVDGVMAIDFVKIPQLLIVEGDFRCPGIGAASIIAKNYHDELMVIYEDMYPGYSLYESKAHATEAHRLAIEKFGLTQEHRECAKKFLPASHLQLSFL